MTQVLLYILSLHGCPRSHMSHCKNFRFALVQFDTCCTVQKIKGLLSTSKRDVLYEFCSTRACVNMRRIVQISIAHLTRVDAWRTVKIFIVPMSRFPCFEMYKFLLHACPLWHLSYCTDSDCTREHGDTYRAVQNCFDTFRLSTIHCVFAVHRCRNVSVYHIQ